jgi:hypothetical protein
MKHLKISLSFLFLSLFVLSCETEMIEKLDLDNLENGAYMRNMSPWPQNTLGFSKATLATAQINVTLEVVDPQNGALFDSYDLTARFVDRTTGNGTNNVPFATTPYLSVKSTSFALNAVSGRPQAVMSLKAADLMTALGLTDAQVAATDQFEINAVMKLKDGRSFNAANTGVNITGGAYYRSPFFYRITVGN